jgi:hypothetical protein
MSMGLAFTPNAVGTVVETLAGATSETTPLVFAGGAAGGQVVVTSPAANAIAFIEFGGPGVVAVAGPGTSPCSMPILPGTAQAFTIGPAVTHVATIGTSGNVFYFTSGQGR